MNKKPIIVPEIGESIKSATIISWQLKPGEYIKEGETLFEIESEKVTMEVPATCNGFLEKDGLKNAGENVKIGQIVGYIKEAKNPEKKGEESKKIPTNKAKEIEQQKPNLISPSAKIIIAEKNIDQKTVKSQQKRIINLYDVIDDSKTESKFDHNKGILEKYKFHYLKDSQYKIIEEEVKILKTNSNKIEYDQIKIKLPNYKNKIEQGANILKSISNGILKYPILNSEIINGNGLIIKKYLNIGMKIFVDDISLMPVFHNIADMSINHIQNAIKSKIKKAKIGKIPISELLHISFPISDLSETKTDTNMVPVLSSSVCAGALIFKKNNGNQYISIAFRESVILKSVANKFLKYVYKDLLKNFR